MEEWAEARPSYIVGHVLKRAPRTIHWHGREEERGFQAQLRFSIHDLVEKPEVVRVVISQALCRVVQYLGVETWPHWQRRVAQLTNRVQDRILLWSVRIVRQPNRRLLGPGP